MGEVIERMHERDYALRTARRSGGDYDWATFRRARNQVKQAIKMAKTTYYSTLIQQSIANDPKRAWKRIKELMPHKEDVRPLKISSNGESVDKNRTK
jgi:hypothetical protein